MLVAPEWARAYLQVYTQTKDKLKANHMKNYTKQVNSDFFKTGNGSQLHIIKNTLIKLSPKCENTVIQMQLLLSP